MAAITLIQDLSRKVFLSLIIYCLIFLHNLFDFTIDLEGVIYMNQ
jgi:hypothetical protein